MKSIKILLVLTSLILSVVVGTAISVSTGWSALIVSGVLFSLSLVPKMQTFSLGMAVTVEIWQKDIEDAIFADNSFINDCVNEDQYVLAGTVVHIPQSGGTAGTVVKNRSQFPAVSVRRADSDITYPLDTYTTDPVTIPFIDQYELSYDKRNSVLGEIKENLLQTIAMELLYKWCYGLPSAAVLTTSGDVVNASSPSATGQRKAATLKDLQAARTYLAKQNRFRNGEMIAVIPSAMIAELFPANDLTTATYMNQVTEEERRQGIIYKVQGWSIKERSSVLVYDADGVLKANGAAGAAGDSEAIFCYNKKSVGRSKGEIKMFAQMDSPNEYGDVYSFLIRMGGRRRRADNVGLCVIKQATVEAI